MKVKFLNNPFFKGIIQIFGSIGIDCLQAPIRQRSACSQISPACTFADILHNIGFSSVEELLEMTEAWNALYDYIDPDVLSMIREFKNEIAPSRKIPVRLRGFRREYQLRDEIELLR